MATTSAAISVEGMDPITHNAPQVYTATIESNNTNYGTVSTASIADIEPGTAITISQDGLTLTIGEFGSVTATPATATPQYTYPFRGWYDGSTLLETGDTIDSDMTITAVFEQAIRQYTVTFAAGSGGTVEPSAIIADYGTSITASSNTVTIGTDTATATPNSSTPQYSYSFDSWTNATGTVDGNRTITANFTATVNTYSVTVTVDPAGAGTITGGPFPNKEYGTAIITDGMTLTIDGTTMTAAVADPTDQYTYSWVGWFIGATEIVEGTTVTGTTAITAKFLATPVQYTITWITGYSTIREKYDYGTMPSIEDPVKEGYYFTGWQPEVTTVTGDATYTATYTAANFGINFSNGNGSKQPVGQYYYSNVDETHTFTITDEEPTWAMHEFKGWSTTKNGAVEYVAGDSLTVTVDEPVTLYAVWERTGGGEVIGSLIDLVPLLFVVGLILGIVGMFVVEKYY